MKSETLFERWAQFVEITDTCWLWRGTLTRARYGHFNFQCRTYIAHRVGYEFFKGPIPAGLVLDHLCRVRCCVKSHDLEPVTDKENLWRGQLSTTLHHIWVGAMHARL